MRTIDKKLIGIVFIVLSALAIVPGTILFFLKIDPPLLLEIDPISFIVFLVLGLTLYRSKPKQKTWCSKCTTEDDYQPE